MTEVIVFNNLTKKEEPLSGHKTNLLNIYTCGPTVYDHSHIGHARASITWDFIVRFLRYIGFNISWTRNITDIDDKIINKANELKSHPDKIARIFTHSYHEDMNALNVAWPDFEPKATQYLHEMIDFIKTLIEMGSAYQIENDVYFSIETFKNYGRLKGQNIKELEKGFGRIEPNPKKKNPLDFALWKGIKNKEEYGFESIWGKGRPGWHLECSVMNHEIYNTNLDIHCGGDDLIFPHHENEIAQSETHSNKQFAKYWLHNGMVLVNGKKMSKSEGNYVTIKDILKDFSGNALRLFILNTHYRMPINFTEEAINAAQNGINRIQESLSDFKNDKESFSEINEFKNEFIEGMSNDFNSPIALSVLFKLTEHINKETSPKEKTNLQKTLLILSKTLGFCWERKPESNSKANTILNTIINELLLWRTECKLNKDFNSSDRIRNILTKSSIEIKDLPDNKSKWQIK